MYDLKTPKGHKLSTIRSMLQKSIRRGNIEDCAYACYEMLSGGYVNYLWKTLMVISAEDCYGYGITQEIESLYRCDLKCNENLKRGQERNRIFISKACIILLGVSKSRDADVFACKYFIDKNQIFDVKKYADEDGVRDEIPEYVYDCHTPEGRSKGKTKDDFFKEEEKSLKYKQQSIFDMLD